MNVAGNLSSPELQTSALLVASFLLMWGLLNAYLTCIIVTLTDGSFRYLHVLIVANASGETFDVDVLVFPC